MTTPTWGIKAFLIASLRLDTTLPQRGRWRAVALKVEGRNDTNSYKKSSDSTSPQSPDILVIADWR
jgi:hypothetical protein